ncbi:MAG: TonB family protein [Acidobacteria bacterium]|nr:TonB family protein [Acidobacteriota bacterium]
MRVSEVRFLTIMDAASNASVISDRQRKYVSMFHEVFLRYSVGFGKASHFAQLVPKLMRNDSLRLDFSMVVQWIQKLEEGHLTLREMLEFIWIAMTGSTGHMDSSSGPLMIFLSGLGGWHETEERETCLKSAPPLSASGSGPLSENPMDLGRKDEPCDARDKWAAAVRRRRLMVALWLLPILPPLILCVALYRSYTGPDTTRDRDATNTASAANKTGWRSGRRVRSNRVSPHPEPDVENNAKETPAPIEQEHEAWPTSGFVVIGEEGQIIRFDQTGATAPARIHVPKPEQLPTIAEGRAGMPGVMPEAIVTLTYPKIVTQEAPRTESVSADPDSGRTTVADANSRRIVDEEKARTSSAVIESRMPVIMPVVVASSTAPPVATVARTENRPTPLKGLSSAKPFELIHPRVAVSAGLLSADIVKFQMPSYPKSARRQMLQGDVLVRVLISEKGKVARALALNGPPSLRGAVEKAVHHWRYVPYMVNGKPVEVQTWVTFHFEMRES